MLNKSNASVRLRRTYGWYDLVSTIRLYVQVNLKYHPISCLSIWLGRAGSAASPGQRSQVCTVAKPRAKAQTPKSRRAARDASARGPERARLVSRPWPSCRAAQQRSFRRRGAAPTLRHARNSRRRRARGRGRRRTYSYAEQRQRKKGRRRASRAR